LASEGGSRLEGKLLAHLTSVLDACASGEGDVQQPPDRAAYGVLQALSDREIEILQRLAQGYTNLAVAQQLFVSTNTIKWHLRHIYGKLNARNRSQAIFAARQQGLLA
jgi:LuxR family maltose regulon positive regulatory protein